MMHGGSPSLGLACFLRYTKHSCGRVGGWVMGLAPESLSNGRLRP